MDLEDNPGPEWNCPDHDSLAGTPEKYISSTAIIRREVLLDMVNAKEIILVDVEFISEYQKQVQERIGQTSVYKLDRKTAFRAASFLEAEGQLKVHIVQMPTGKSTFKAHTLLLAKNLDPAGAQVQDFVV